VKTLLVSLASAALLAGIGVGVYEYEISNTVVVQRLTDNGTKHSAIVESASVRYEIHCEDRTAPDPHRCYQLEEGKRFRFGTFIDVMEFYDEHRDFLIAWTISRSQPKGTLGRRPRYVRSGGFTPLLFILPPIPFASRGFWPYFCI
jgi:hypothetical protein